MGVSWLKKGAESAQLADQNKAEMQKRREERDKMYRFFLKPGEKAQITFVDGELTDGVLIPNRYWEHTVYGLDNRPQHFVCPEKNNPGSGEKCPICAGNDRPYLISLFTIIDHRTFERRDGTTGGNEAKILAAKPTPFEMLNMIGQKRGGLAGCRFEVFRATDKDAAIGGFYDFEEKLTLAECESKYLTQVKDEKGTVSMVSAFKVADYENEILYYTGAELAKMGLGNSTNGQPASGYQPAQPTAQAAKPANEQIAEHL